MVSCCDLNLGPPENSAKLLTSRPRRLSVLLQLKSHVMVWLKFAFRGRVFSGRISFSCSRRFAGGTGLLATCVLNGRRLLLSRGIQSVTGGTEQTSGECSLGQTIPI